MQSAGQELAVQQLKEICGVNDAIELLAVYAPTGEDELVLDVSIDCGAAPNAASGIVLRSRERFLIMVPTNFPFSPPRVRVPHLRWAGRPHVQWGSVLCIYAAPSVEWLPEDGMRGLLDRLLLWLQAASLGRLDPDDRPIHPPVAYTTPGAGTVIVRANIGDLAPEASAPERVASADAQPNRRLGYQHRFVVGLCRRHGSDRVDVVEWMTPIEWLRRCIAGHRTESAPNGNLIGALAILTDGELAFEYPDQLVKLFDGLASLGVERSEILEQLAYVAAGNQLVIGADGAAALRVFVGTPSRKVPGSSPRQHLVCWMVDDFGRRVGEILAVATSEDEAIKEIRARVLEIADSWIRSSAIRWECVYEDRPEVTIRRDFGSAIEWLRGRRVLILGCGALGAPIAEHCVRAGCAVVTVVDSGIITPGILVRQPYRDSDVGQSKARVCASRLNAIRDDSPAIAVPDSVQNFFRRDGVAEATKSDLVIDATADTSVASLLELVRSRNRDSWPSTLSILIGQSARRGVVCVARPGATGCGRDILRRLALDARGHQAARLTDVAGEIFPSDGPANHFQPEPGCSTPTFVGSAAELAALSGALLDAALCAANSHRETAPAEPMAAGVIRLGANAVKARWPNIDWFDWPNAALSADAATGYEVRIDKRALATMRAESRRGRRLRGRRVETGGTLFGRIDDACRCVWVDIATGPPPDSHLHERYFDHGTEGLNELIEYHRGWSGTLTSYLGMWHAHPLGRAAPSCRDNSSRHTLVNANVGGPPRALMVIIGGDEARWAAWLNNEQYPDIYTELLSRTELEDIDQIPQAAMYIANDDWPGGWRMPERVRPRDSTSLDALASFLQRILGRR